MSDESSPIENQEQDKNSVPKNSLLEIEEAEEKAEKMITNAKSKEEQLLLEKTKQKDQELQDIIAKEKVEAGKVLHSFKDEKTVVYKSKMGKIQALLSDLENKSRSNEEIVVNKIVQFFQEKINV